MPTCSIQICSCKGRWWQTILSSRSYYWLLFYCRITPSCSVQTYRRASGSWSITKLVAYLATIASSWAGDWILTPWSDWSRVLAFLACDILQPGSQKPGNSYQMSPQWVAQKTTAKHGPRRPKTTSHSTIIIYGAFCKALARYSYLFLLYNNNVYVATQKYSRGRGINCWDSNCRLKQSRF